MTEGLFDLTTALGGALGLATYGEYVKKGEGIKEMASDLATGVGAGVAANAAVSAYDYITGSAAPSTPKDLEALDSAIQEFERKEAIHKFARSGKKYAREFYQGAKSYLFPKKSSYPRWFGRLAARYGYYEAKRLWRGYRSNRKSFPKKTRTRPFFVNPRRQYAFGRGISHNRFSHSMPGYRRFSRSRRFGRRPVRFGLKSRSRFMRPKRSLYRPRRAGYYRR